MRLRSRHSRFLHRAGSLMAGSPPRVWARSRSGPGPSCIRCAPTDRGSDSADAAVSFLSTIDATLAWAGAPRN